MHIAELDQQAGQLRFLTGRGAFADEVHKESEVFYSFSKTRIPLISLCEGKRALSRKRTR